MEFPCIDAMIAYLRNYLNGPLESILMKHVSPLYNCRTLYHLCNKIYETSHYKCIDVRQDNLGTEQTQKKSSGMSKSKKTLKSIKYKKPEDSNISCKLQTKYTKES